MKIIKIISEHNKPKRHRLMTLKGKQAWVDIPRSTKGYKRVEAIIEEFGMIKTKHIDVAISNKLFDL